MLRLNIRGVKVNIVSAEGSKNKKSPGQTLGVRVQTGLDSDRPVTCFHIIPSAYNYIDNDAAQDE